jgi:hypothetical protein
MKERGMTTRSSTSNGTSFVVGERLRLVMRASKVLAMPVGRALHADFSTKSRRVG